MISSRKKQDSLRENSQPYTGNADPRGALSIRSSRGLEKLERSMRPSVVSDAARTRNADRECRSRMGCTDNPISGKRTEGGKAVSAERSRLMSLVRQKGTAPELVVRRLLRDLGVSYRVNVRALPGSPDIVLANQKKAIVVHGCFWHRHHGCRAASSPRSRVKFWSEKFATNIARDRRTRRQLNALGYSVMVIWECQAKRSSERDKMLKRLIRFAKTVEA
jgi:DNA mismatch endonuclease (patch repair protein)